MTVLINWLG
jgi:hypothetical protein